MSVEFEVKTRLRRFGKVHQVVSQWLEAGTPLCLDQVGDEYGWVFAPGASIRGFSITRERKFLGECFRVRLSVGASREDWRLAFAFLRAAANRGARIEDESGNRLRLEQLSDTAATSSAKDQLRKDIQVLREIASKDGKEPIKLPNVRFSHALRLDDLPAEPTSAAAIEQFEASLASRTLKYRGVRVAATIILGNGRTLAVWSGERLIIPAVDWLLFPPAIGDKNIDGYVAKPLGAALTDLGDAAEPVDGQASWYFLRSLDPANADDVRKWEALQLGAQDKAEAARP